MLRGNWTVTIAAQKIVVGRGLRFPNGKDYYALGRLPAGEMNKLEARYAQHLELLKRVGEILFYKFEGVKFRLADNTFYTPDFAVLGSDMLFELREVKGGIWEEDARCKIKVAASLYPFRFIAVTALPAKLGGGWKTEEF